MKKLLAILLLLCLAAGLSACWEKTGGEIETKSASAESTAGTSGLSEEEEAWLAEFEAQYPYTFQTGGFTIRYYVEDGEAVVSDGWEGDENGTFIVPLTIDGMPIRWLSGVGDYLLRKLHCSELIVPAGVTDLCIDLSSAETVKLGPGVESFEISRGYVTRFEVDPENASLSEIDGVLFNKDGTVLMQYPTGRPWASYKIPEGVEAIAAGALWFSRPLELKTVEVPASVTVFPDDLDDLINTYGYQLTFSVMEGSAAEGYFKGQQQSEAYKGAVEETGEEPFLLNVLGWG